MLVDAKSLGHAGALAEHSRELAYISKANGGGNLANIPLGSYEHFFAL
jgi:hypothetical protein